MGSFYDGDPQAFRRSQERFELQRELFQGLNVLETVRTSADPQARGSRLLKQEVEVLTDRVQAMLRGVSL